jgi:uncharacterized membrane protein (DUF106 family)
MAFLDPVLSWLLYLDPALGIMIVSLLVSIIITVAIKYLSNQSLMKDLREELKELQKQMKSLKNNPNKLSKVNSQFMETNMKYMTHSMRPTLFTFLPIILVFGWLNSHIAYYPIMPNQEFDVSVIFKEGDGSITLKDVEGITFLDPAEKQISGNKVSWTLSGKEGVYDLEFTYKDTTYTKDVIITTKREYAKVEQSFSKGLFSSSDENGLSKIVVSNEKVLPFTTVPVIKDIPWVSTWSWLGAYFLFSIVFSMSLRKFFKIY